MTGFQRYPSAPVQEAPPEPWLAEAEEQVHRAAPAQLIVAVGCLLAGLVCAVAVLGFATSDEISWPLVVPASVLACLSFFLPGAALLWALLTRSLPTRLRRLEAAWWFVAAGSMGNALAYGLVIVGQVMAP